MTSDEARMASGASLMSLRPSAILVLACGLLLASGCYIGPDWQTRQAQLRTMQIYRQNQILAGQMGQMSADRAALEQQLAIANQRLDNLNSERAALHDRYKHLLTSSQNPLPAPATARFRDLAERYPEFEFDPETGVSKFNTDLLFPLGSDEIRAESQQLLQEFAAIMNSDDARQFNILVVGHTDDLPIKRSGTAQRHPTNWELSAHRGTAVIHALSKYGLAENRMGVSGYSMYQPVAPNSSDSNRQKNRRVEIYVLAPDARVATGG
jgi:chemotaxis protein MotB